MSQQPAGEPLSLCQPPPLPAHPAFSLVTAIEGSWTLSFLLSWGGGKEGTGSFSLYVKRLGASTSTTLGLNSGLGIRREPPSVRHTHTHKKNPQAFVRSNGSMTQKFRPGQEGTVEAVLLTRCSQDARGRPVVIHRTCPHSPVMQSHGCTYMDPTWGTGDERSPRAVQLQERGLGLSPPQTGQNKG